MKKLLIATISFLLIILLTGCNVDRTKEDTEGKLIVHTSVYPLEDFTKKKLVENLFVLNQYIHQALMNIPMNLLKRILLIWQMAIYFST